MIRHAKIGFAVLAFTAVGCRGCKTETASTVKKTGQVACTGDADCASDEQCVLATGICQTNIPGLGGINTTCVVDSDCQSVYTCQNKLCEPAPPPSTCTCAVSPTDRDGDCEPDIIENPSGDGQYIEGRDFTDVNNPDTDGDGILDGCEDRNHNGIVDTTYPPELDPRKLTGYDSDKDGLPDGIEDANKNGFFDPQNNETDGTNPDTDFDGFLDGDEDRNHDGIWNCSVETAPGSGIYTVIDGPPCELNPRTSDTDGDGLSDSVEMRATADASGHISDATFYVPGGLSPDSNCNAYGVAVTPAPPNDTTSVPGHILIVHDWNNTGHTPGRYSGKDGIAGTSDDQTCPWNADSDGDGIRDGLENKSASGSVGLGETDPRLADSDGDGLPDGVEDLNQDGLFDPTTETDPTRADTDGDGILDGIEDSGGCVILHTPGSSQFKCDSSTPPSGTAADVTPPAACDCTQWENGTRQPNESDPRLPDTDGDGIADGIEDQNGDGYCSRAVDHATPKPGDESCAWTDQSDSDQLSDGAEDANGNGKRDPGETDPRYGDPDNDCLKDDAEVQLGLDPFNADSDGDHLLDGLEAAGLLFTGTDCVCINGGPQPCSLGAPSYLTTTCPNPHIKDSDGDGLADGSETVAGVTIGEDLNGNGVVDAGESNPCDPNSPSLPTIGNVAVNSTPTGVSGTCVDGSSCAAPSCGSAVCPANCPPCSSLICEICNDTNFATPPNPAAFPDPGHPAEGAAYNEALKLVCTDGKIKPIIANVDALNDFTLAMPAYRDANQQPAPLYTTQEIDFGGNPIGLDFFSNDTLTETQVPPFQAVFGGIVRMGTVILPSANNHNTCDTVVDSPPLLDTILPQPAASGTCAPTQNFVVANSQPLPSDVAERTQGRIGVTLAALGYSFDRTAGGNFFAHDDQTGSGLPGAITVQGATDTFVVRKSAGGAVDPAAIDQAVLAALTGGNKIDNQLSPPATYATGPVVAALNIEYYRRVVLSRQFNSDGSTYLNPTVEYGAVFAVSPELVARECSQLTGSDRQDCQQLAEQATIPVDDLTNGSALGRADASFGSGCEPFVPAPSKADFLLAIDDSVSMQGYIVAIQAAARTVSQRLEANKDNLDWRIAITTSNLGRADSEGYLSALNDSYDFDPTNIVTYPYAELTPGTSGDSGVAIYQTGAFASTGLPTRCVYGDSYSTTDPTVSPYCCNDASDSDATFVQKCCELPNTFTLPTSYTTEQTANDGDMTVGDAKNTLRCFDYPRYDNLGNAWLTGDTTHAAPYSPDAIDRARNFNDYLCGDGEDFSSAFLFRHLWGARGHLFPPGFVGANSANPRADGANLLIRNADMLVTQMNRPCAFGAYTPRGANGSEDEHPLQNIKRAIERSLAPPLLPPGRAAAGANAAANQLRQDAPVFAIILSDEEDYSAKYLNNATDPPTIRDQSELPPARCFSNPSDDGCTVPYCQSCFEGVGGQDYVEQATPVSSYSLRIPAARSLASSATVQLDAAAGNYCVSPRAPNFSTAGLVPGDARYDGFGEINAGIDPNSDTTAGAYADPNDVTHDWLNINNAAPVVCNNACGSDCLPCIRFLREKQYTDFFNGACSPPISALQQTGAGQPFAAASTDPRQYPPPFLTLPDNSTLQLPLGKVYAITRQTGLQGGNPSACGSSYPGGDGLAHRDIALASGGSVADICLANSPGGFTDFLDQIIVDAQGVGSPYRLRGDPISSTIAVGVIAKDGNLYLLKRSSVSGFDYNSTSRSIAFFTRGTQFNGSNTAAYFSDYVNDVANWEKVLISYRVWERECPSECALGDVCGVCSCSAATPECCTAVPLRECHSTQTCVCGACQVCDDTTNTCRPDNPCPSGCAAGQQCDTTLNGGTCVPCAPGTTSAAIPCGGGESCAQQNVCVAQVGVGNTSGASCQSDPLHLNTTGAAGQDCCGTSNACSGNNVCVLDPCVGGVCSNEAHCRAFADACETGGACATDADCPSPLTCDTVTTNSCVCPNGTQCSPLPCPNPNSEGGGAICPPVFECTALGGANLCASTSQCGCPDGQFCSDCGPCKTCNGGQCSLISVCAGLQGESAVATCAANNPSQCCPDNQVYDPSTGTCITNPTCDPPCTPPAICADHRCVIGQ